MASRDCMFKNAVWEIPKMGFNFNNSLEELTGPRKASIPMGTVYYSMRTWSAISKVKICIGQSPRENRSRFTVALSQWSHADSSYSYQEQCASIFRECSQPGSLIQALVFRVLFGVNHISRADSLHG